MGVRMHRTIARNTTIINSVASWPANNGPVGEMSWIKCCYYIILSPHSLAPGQTSNAAAARMERERERSRKRILVALRTTSNGGCVK